MQQSVSSPYWLGIAILPAAGLAIVALIAVFTVLLASGLPIIPRQRIKSLGMTLLLIVPALFVVIFIVRFANSRTTTIHYSGEQRIHDVLQSTVTSNNNRSTPSPKLVAEVDERLTDEGDEADAEDANPSAMDRARERARKRAHARQKNAGNNNIATAGSPAIPISVLKVRETRTKKPDWAEADPVPSSDGVLVPFSSQRFATLAEAEQQVTDQALEYVKEFYRPEYPLPGDWTVPVSVIEQSSVNAFVGEKFEKDFGNGVAGTMYRAHLRLDVNSALRKGLIASWHDQIVAHRLTELGGFLGLATLCLATCAGYFRLDTLTAGQYRRRLRIAAASLIAAGSLVAWHRFWRNHALLRRVAGVREPRISACNFLTSPGSVSIFIECARRGDADTGVNCYSLLDPHSAQDPGGPILFESVPAHRLAGALESELQEFFRLGFQNPPFRGAHDSR